MRVCCAPRAMRNRARWACRGREERKVGWNYDGNIIMNNENVLKIFSCAGQFYTCPELSYSKGAPWVSSICTLESLSLSLPSPVLWRLAPMDYITILPCSLASHWICPIVVRVSHWSPCMITLAGCFSQLLSHDSLLRFWKPFPLCAFRSRPPLAEFSRV